MTSWDRILCPVDFSDTSRAAMDVAVDLAVKLGASLELYHAVAPPMASLPEAPFPGRQVIDALVAASRKRLDEWKTDAEAMGAPHVEVVQALGMSAEGILDRAHHSGCGVIVLGTHGRGFIKRAILGSVAEQVLRRAPCPVLAVGPAAAARQERKAS
ncbi:MAG TPA: universal stress protein [Haliangiales bacterium]|nr:universal stress protein [Haliangiales bacterium]